MPKIINLTGISDIRLAPEAGKLQKKIKGRGLILTSSEGRAKRIAADLSFFAPCKVLTLPDDDVVFTRYEARSSELLAGRIAAYRLLSGSEPGIVVAPVRGALKPLPPKEVFLKNMAELSVGDEIERDRLIENFADMGYERVPSAEAPGQYAVRGDIVDIFCPGDAEPIRIEFFDMEIDSIRYFDPLSQRSTGNAGRVRIYPARILTEDAEAFERAALSIAADGSMDEDDRKFVLECISERMNFQYLERFMKAFYPNPSYIWDFLNASSFILADDMVRISEELKSEELYLELVSGIEKSAAGFLYYCSSFAGKAEGTSEPSEIIERDVRQVPVFNGRMDMLISSLKGFVSEGYSAALVCSSHERIMNLSGLLDRENLGNKVALKEGSLSSGCILGDFKEVYISESDIFPNIHRKKKRRHKEGSAIKAFSDLKKGDLVVHEIHGVGRFAGIEKMSVQGSARDYLRIEYAGSDVLYIPVDQMESVQKYIGSDSSVPKINSLSGSEWQRTKAKAKAAVKDMAKDFLKLSAERASVPGFSFGEDSVWQKDFEDAFPYAETEDQLRCSMEIKKDMESSKAMDRLLCGDVGYGKTEVACRAIFKCLEQGKQAAVLVPTTVLASQHYRTFKSRFGDYPFAVDMLSRFRTPAEQEKTVRELASGGIDLVVGTHRLLSKDVKFKDLGLLVVDEEQRFGVAHKEAIKKLRANVDVLTLTATPIPRTLHMSLVGIRDMSIIEEPPEDRYPVQTYVMEQDDALLKQALKRELARGGQAFVVYNRVRGIYAAARRVQELVPEAKVSVGHGQMAENELEDIMLDFSEGKSDILVSTTIIESGLDIPNVNTLIVMDADRFGLSQLYQLRGRVGRSNRMAYAYLMYKKNKVLGETAEKRLRAIKEFTEFGSGFRIAMRDLELRGAGNILGAEQSGHMLSVGYELYCKLIDEAVRELRGEALPKPPEDSSVELGLAAYIPSEYISDEITKLDMYRSISSCETDSDRSDILDELTDRFGDPPRETLNLIEIAITRNLASRCGISKVVSQKDRLVFVFAEENILRPEIFARLIDSYGNAITIYGGVKPRISLFVRGEAFPKAAQRMLRLMLEDKDGPAK